MKKYFGTISAVFFLLSLSQAAFGCTMFKPLSKTDVAFADVIFEGRIQDVNSGEYVFDVTRVVKGNLSQAQVLVGLIDGVAYAPPKSKEEFISRYGDLTRIALTTPEQIKNFCNMQKSRSVKFRDGAQVVTYVDALKCDNSLLRPNYPRAKEIPFIVRQPCGQPYIFSVENYSKMENYPENVRMFEHIIENTPSTATYNRRELYEVITGGVGPLPWEMGK
jgi:hypothetical protein